MRRVIPWEELGEEGDSFVVVCAGELDAWKCRNSIVGSRKDRSYRIQTAIVRTRDGALGVRVWRRGELEAS